MQVYEVLYCFVLQYEIFSLSHILCCSVTVTQSFRNRYYLLICLQVSLEVVDFFWLRRSASISLFFSLSFSPSFFLSFFRVFTPIVLQ